MRLPRPAERARPRERPGQAAALRALLAPRAPPPLPTPDPPRYQLDKPEVIDLDSDEDSGSAAGPGRNPSPDPGRAGAPRAYVGAYSAARLGGGGTQAAGGTAGGTTPGGERGALGSGAWRGRSPGSPLPPSACAAARSAAPAGPGSRAAGCEGGPGFGQGSQAGGVPVRAGSGGRHEPPWFHRLPDFVPVAAIAMRDGRDPRCVSRAWGIASHDACGCVVSIRVACPPQQDWWAGCRGWQVTVCAPASIWMREAHNVQNRQSEVQSA